MFEYRGYTLTQDDTKQWWAEAGGGTISLGPFRTAEEATQAVDRDLDDYRGEHA